MQLKKTINCFYWGIITMYLLTIKASYAQILQKAKIHPPKFECHSLSNDTIPPQTPYFIGIDKDIQSSFTP